MSTLEARITEVLAGHQLVGISLHEDAHCTGSGCGWAPTSSFLFPTADHRAHVAQMLAPVITSSNAKAWHEGFNDGKRQDAEGEDGPRFTNPYKEES